MIIVGKDTHRVRLRILLAERDALLTLLSLGESLSTSQAELSRTSPETLPPDATETLIDALNEQRKTQVALLRGWLQAAAPNPSSGSSPSSESAGSHAPDPGDAPEGQMPKSSSSEGTGIPRKRRPLSERSMVLTLSWEEIDIFLQTVNRIRVHAWMQLGYPDFEKGKFPDITESNMLRLWMMQFSESILGTLLSLMSSD